MGGAFAEKATMGLAFEMAGVVVTSACSVARKVHPDKPGGSQEESNISLLNYLTDCTIFEGIQVD